VESQTSRLCYSRVSLQRQQGGKKAMVTVPLPVHRAKVQSLRGGLKKSDPVPHQAGPVSAAPPCDRGAKWRARARA
jgi:hypothetical protein